MCHAIVTGELKEEFIKVIVSSGLLTSIKTRLEQHDCSVELVAQLIAEMAKTGKNYFFL